MTIFDSHCHLQDVRLAPWLPGVMERARAVGVSGFLCCGTEEADWPAVEAQVSPGIVPAFGVHPWRVEARSAGWLVALRGCLDRQPSAVVGEIGLDFAVERRCDALQEEVFSEQLRLASACNRVASIHCRRAWNTLQRVLKETGAPPRGFVIHSYSGGTGWIAPLMDLGGYFSFSGSVTLSGNRKAHQAAQAVPSGRLLVETDAPDQSPLGWDVGRPNEPGTLGITVDALAGLRGTTSGEIARVTWENANRLFGRR
jgi:TatD DNase family protein